MASSGEPLPLPFPSGIPPGAATNGGGDSGLIEVVPVPILTDNIAYLLVDGTAAAAVDPAVPAEMVRAAIDRGVAITAVLTTHKHWEYGRCMHFGSCGGEGARARTRDSARVDRAQRGAGPDFGLDVGTRARGSALCGVRRAACATGVALLCHAPSLQ